MKYNPTDKDSIYEYAKGLKGKTFNDLCNDYYSENSSFFESIFEDSIAAYSNLKTKGSLGEVVEEMYFNYKANSDALPDFPDAKVELKVTPYKINKNGSLSAKERLIISMINYMDLVNMDFYSSNAWSKLQNLLLVYYLWNPLLEDKLDYLINYVYMYTPIGEDLKIIKEDFYKIKQKVIEGKAHELSEADTIYLGAATKSANSTNRRIQPNSEILAKPRAFSLKSSYMTYILRNYIVKDQVKQDRIIEDSTVDNFEAYILNKINKYIGWKDKDLFLRFFDFKEYKSKDMHSRIALKILNVKSDNAEEFAKANIIVKAIRVESNNKIKESMSFPVFKIKELVRETWEKSEINEFFSTTKFLFVIYKKEGDSYYLKGAKFWNMPTTDIDGGLKDEWLKIRDTFINGVKFKIKGNTIYNNLPKKSNSEILHVRPHAARAAYLIDGQKYGNGKLERDSDELPNSDRMTKQCFWLNNSYILNQISEHI